jgi:hypothetical protein
MLMETGGSSSGDPKRLRVARANGLRRWLKHMREWVTAITVLPILVVVMLIKPEWFTTSDE